MLPFNGPLPCLVLPPNHWIKLVAIVLHCLYWELLEFIKKKSNPAYLYSFSNSNILFFFFTSSSYQKKKKIIKQNKRRVGIPDSYGEIYPISKNWIRESKIQRF